MPTKFCKSDGTSLACDRSMSALLMTDTSGKASCARCKTRLAVMTMSACMV